MKFTCNIEIEAPQQIVVDFFTNTENFPKWQIGFISHEIISGKYLEKGTKSRINFKNRNNSIELTETIIINNLPNELTALYEHKHMTNTTLSRFVKLDENRTRLEYKVEMLKINGFIPKIMIWLFPGMMSKQTQRWLENFKSLIEK